MFGRGKVTCVTVARKAFPGTSCIIKNLITKNRKAIWRPTEKLLAFLVGASFLRPQLPRQQSEETNTTQKINALFFVFSFTQHNEDNSVTYYYNCLSQCYLFLCWQILWGRIVRFFMVYQKLSKKRVRIIICSTKNTCFGFCLSGSILRHLPFVRTGRPDHLACKFNVTCLVLPNWGVHD